MEDEFAEIAIEREDDSRFGLCEMKDVAVGRAGGMLDYPKDIVSLLAQELDNFAIDVFIREEFHAADSDKNTVSSKDKDLAAKVSAARMSSALRCGYERSS